MNIDKLNEFINHAWIDLPNAVLNPEMTFMVKNLTVLDLTVRKMATTHIGLLISMAVSCLNDDECYVNIGTWNGYSFFAGFILNSDKTCIGNDNFSLFNGQHGNNSIEKDKANRDFGNIKECFYKEFNRIKNYNSIFVEKDWKEFLRNLGDITNKKVGLYFYDGDHGFDSQYYALENIIPYLSEKAIIFVDDTNIDDVKVANKTFLQKHSEFSLLYDIKTPCNRYPTWWDGIQIIAKG
jgi:hypothetical protein